ncbi:hypothetical protein [Nostoc sp. UIC 10630]|uniref:hypothetical protein n=1 Tax=Nostoc sp. UIC 10630 TaxID=2100146 RepID=UPI001FB0FFB5|nr:hypothetical protein [Nostoc sp. UIC 10630]
MKFFSDHLREQNLNKVIESDRLRSDLPFRRWRSPTFAAAPNMARHGTKAVSASPRRSARAC